MKAAKVKDLLDAYKKDGIKGLKDYFNNSYIQVYEDTFEWRIKRWLELESYKSVKLELETLFLKLNNYDKKERKNEYEDKKGN